MLIITWQSRAIISAAQFYKLVAVSVWALSLFMRSIDAAVVDAILFG